MPKVAIKRSSHLVRSLRALSDNPKLSAKMRLRACEDLMLVDPSINDSELRLRLQMLNRSPLTPLTLGMESGVSADGSAGQTETGTSQDLEALALKLDRGDRDADLEALVGRAPAGPGCHAATTGAPGDSKGTDGHA